MTFYQQIENPEKVVMDSVKLYLQINGKRQQENSEIAVKIGPDPKKWQQADLDAMANNLNSYEYYYRLLRLAAAANTKDKTSGEYTPAARRAQTILDEFSGNRWSEFAGMLHEAGQPYKAVLNARRDESKKANTDYYAGLLTKAGWKELDAVQMIHLTAPRGTVILGKSPYIEVLANLIERANEKENTGDASDGKPTKMSLYAQEILNSLSKKGDWKVLAKDVADVQKVLMSDYLKDQKEKKQQSTRTTKLPDPANMILPTGVNVTLADQPGFSQEEALAMLDNNGVKLDAVHELKSPDHKAIALNAVKRITGSVRVA